MMTERDFYQVLGVARTASRIEIRAAYVRLARHHHPDRTGQLPNRLGDIQQAYRCLSDAETRAVHNRQIAQIERAHLARQYRIHQRLRRYDRHYRRAKSVKRRRRGRAVNWRMIVVMGVVLMALTRLSPFLPQ
jgi:curved DNA-binding protein CbpA